jgi:hypothetical protein
MLGNFAGSLIFICGMLGWVLLASSLALYAAHCFVVVVTDTAAGLDEVRWPAETMVDWIGQALRFVVTLATVLIPIGFAFRALGDSIYPPDPLLGFVVLTGLWLWVAFPIALLSAMTFGSPFAVIHPGVLWELLRLTPSMVLFYLLTAPLYFVVGLLWYQALVAGEYSLVVPAAVAGAMGVLIYARLIGRIGWSIGELQPKKRKRPAGMLKPKLRKQIRVSDPWAAPEEEKPRPRPEAAVAPKAVPKPAPQPAMNDLDDEFAPPTPYGLGSDPVCRPPKYKLIEGSPFLDVELSSPVAPSRESIQLPPQPAARSVVDGKPIEMLPADAEESPPDQPEVAPSQMDMWLSRPDAPPPPAFPMFSGVYSFPFYPTCLRALFVLAFSSLALGLGLQALIAVYPRG